METSDEQKLAIAKYVGCPIWWLVNEQNIKFEPKDISSESDSSILFMILDVMDGCADNDIDKAMQIQLSRVVLYHLNEKDSEQKSLLLLQVLIRRNCISLLPEKKTEIFLLIMVSTFQISFISKA